MPDTAATEAARTGQQIREASMAKGQVRSNREVRKPKKDKAKPSTAPVSSFTTQIKSAEASSPKKR
ncbi:hypothetical protein ACQKGC_14900 [Allorhizobium pseudoryzae]|uniref:hypothetical protein n=1 Tax=Allorhizobium pseudoryzae TaxID=379684 RepID=UPI0013EA1A8C|nr:hypothetical protein [Allorhizobium pseudoryzae]